jgi:hypothetical protein
MTKVHVLTGFAARVLRGLYGRGKRIVTGTVIGALTAIGQEIALARGKNPTKVAGSKKLLPRLSQMYNSWRKQDPPTSKQLPVEADVPELLVKKGRNGAATELKRAIRDLSLITFYYLLCIGEYTIKGKWNEIKQTVQFKYKDVTFFKKNTTGQLRCLPLNAPAHLIATADSATMKLDNQKNGWKGICIYQEANGNEYLCPVKALGRCFLHLQLHGGTGKTFLSLYWVKGIKADVTAKHISRALKSVAKKLQYPTNKGIPIT